MTDELATVGDLIVDPDFLIGVVIGAVLYVGLYVASTVDWAVRGWAAFLAGAGALALSFRVSTVEDLVLAIALVGASGFVFDLARSDSVNGYSVGWLLASALAIGASSVWLADQGIESVEPALLYALPGVVLVVAASLFWTSRGRDGQLLGPMVALSFGGVWVTVPETDAVVVILGMAIAFGAATLPPVRGRAVGAGSAALAGLFVWLALFGGATRPESVVASWTAIGLIPVLPALGGMEIRGLRLPLLLIGHFSVVAVITRVVDAGASVAVILVTYAGLLALVAGAFTLLRRQPVRV